MEQTPRLNIKIVVSEAVFHNDISSCIKLYFFDKVSATVSLCYRGGGDHKIPEGKEFLKENVRDYDLSH